MSSTTITSANAIFMLAVEGVYNTYQSIKGFATDAAFAFDATQPAEAVMGVDGIMSAGWLPTTKVQSVSLQADSESMAIFETWEGSQRAQKELYFASGTITIPGLRKEIVLTKGVLTGFKHSDAKKTMQPCEFKITWELAEVNQI